MEKEITVKNEYNTLDKVVDFLKNKSNYESSIEYDIWEMRTDTNGQMEQCVVIKKSAMHGMKVYFSNENSLKMTYIIPNKIMNAYFGKSVKIRRNILEIIAEAISQALLSGSQKKAFEEMEQIFNEVKA